MNLKLKDFPAAVTEWAVAARLSGQAAWYKAVNDLEPANTNGDGDVVESTIGNPTGLAALGDDDGPLLLDKLTIETTGKIF